MSRSYLFFLKSTTMSRLLLAAVPTDLLRLVQVKLASTTTTHFPFPTHPRPTPHQIFHLAPNASQSDIKARCMPFLCPIPNIHSFIHLFAYSLIRLALALCVVYFSKLPVTTLRWGQPFFGYFGFQMWGYLCLGTGCGQCLQSPPFHF